MSTTADPNEDVPPTPAAIVKSTGQTRTEKFLAELCDRTFLKVWAYANPFKSDRKEVCDVIAVFANHVFLFFDRESRKFDGGKEVDIAWDRWHREAIEKQINTARGAKRYIIEHPTEVFLDAACTMPLPIRIPTEDLIVHKIVVAHGAKEACEAFSDSNVYGSLAVSYGKKVEGQTFPFMIWLDKNDPVHVLDSHNLEIVLGELDTFQDFVSYITEKERAIQAYDFLTYCGEEDLLAHWFLQFDVSRQAHFIGTADKTVNGLMIGEGEWHDFSRSEPYRLKKLADQDSYLWDEIIQRTCQNALDGRLLGNGDLFNRQSAIHEMAKEPRVSRRALSKAMIASIREFPDTNDGITRNLSFMPSFFDNLGYVFLQLYVPNIVDYDGDYRLKRQKLLQVACGVAKNKFPKLTKVVGIAIDAPKLSKRNAEDFVLLDCDKWPEEQRTYYEVENKNFNFFETPQLRSRRATIREFPQAEKAPRPRKIGRNEPCPCGSGKKFKKCCDPSRGCADERIRL